MDTKHSLTPASMRREIGLAGAVSILAGIMIGSGIFYIGGIVFERAALSPSLTLLAWVVGGLVTLLSGICFAELGAMMPKAGGFYVYLREAYGNRIAYVSGLSHFLLTGPGSVAALAMAMSAALASIVPLDALEQKMLAVAVVTTLTLVNLKGIRLSARLQTFFLLVKLVPIVVLLVGGLWVGREPIEWSIPADVSVLEFCSMIGFAVIATLWAYEGWSNLNTVAEEVKNPSRNIPLALIGAIVGVALLYTLFHVAIFRALPLEAMIHSVREGDWYLGAHVARVLFGEAGMVFVAVAMTLAIFNSLNGCVMVFPRLYYAMARDGVLFESMGRLHPVSGTPVVAQWVSCALAIVLICFRSLGELTSLVAVCALIINCLAFYSVVLLRRRRPKLERPYRVWLYPLSIVLVLAVTFGLIVNTFVNDPITAMMGIVIAVIGWFSYGPTVGRTLKQRAKEPLS